jgi:hypothetical protein
MSVRRIVLCMLLAGSTGLGLNPAEAATVIEIDVAPPAPRVVEVPPPRHGYVWADGYWRWKGHHHVWVNGHWVREKHGWHWVPDHWVAAGPKWRFVPGHWEH